MQFNCSTYDLLTATRFYRRLGCCVIPVDGKRSLCEWKNPPSDGAVDRIIESGGASGVAIVCGAPSGGLCCRDFDEMEAFEEWATTEPELARILPIERTPRPGRHVFFRGGCRLQRVRGGELRGDGGYVVVAPSLHNSGGRYEWEHALYADLPEIDASRLIGVMQPFPSLSLEERPAREKPLYTDVNTIRQYKQPQYELCVEISNSAYVTDENYSLNFIEWAIKRTLPNGPGQRNNCAFKLARYLRQIFPVEAGEELLLPIVQRWFALASPNVTTQQFSVTWDDFLRAWGNPRLGHGGFLANTAGLVGADEFEVGNRNTNQDKVARVFRAAAYLSGETAFYLGCRDIGKIACMGHRAANRHCHGLVAAGLLRCIKLGLKGTKHRIATIWRWDGPRLETNSETNCE